MSNCSNFHTQLVSVMEVLAKAAVAEISKLVDGSCAVLRLEMYRYQKENEALKTKLKLMERELRAARRSPARGSRCAERVSARARSHRASPVSPTEAADFAVGDGDKCDPTPTPAEAPEEKVTQPTPAGDPEEQVTQPTPAEDPEELSEKRRCGHSEEDLSGLEFVVKAEQEEEHVAQRLSQTGCEHSAGRLNNLDSEYVTYERDGQLWTSFTPGDSDIETDDPVCDNATEQYSQSLPVHTELQHAPAADAASANSISSFAIPYVHMFDMIPVKKEAEMQGATGESRPEGESREQLSSARDSQTLQARQQLHGPSAKLMSGSESAAELSSDTQYEGGYTLSGNSFNTKKMKSDGRAGSGKKSFLCPHCGKSLAYFSCYKVHLRSHTGEKPYSCAECGKCFTQQSNLTKHESVHSGKKPFHCAQCGKSFRHRYNLTLHQRIHSGERPFHCTQCGKSFAQSCHFKRHQRCHMGEKTYSCC
ncbi:zinc finger protein 34-like [Megalops cyprinoides]|uniref:zinc finger protein 34-like n=1 Tax=Megalops cyprinoides TaxID=118141 RepID=UPI001863D2FD|nr:zinc finger protein 34-like [Megalops cyprinoides]